MAKDRSHILSQLAGNCVTAGARHALQGSLTNPTVIVRSMCLMQSLQ